MRVFGCDLKDAIDAQECKEEGFLDMVQKTDAELSSQGYKTIAVAAGVEGHLERPRK